MKPAFSVLFFTVSSGAGYGLLIWMLHFQLFGHATINVTELFVISFVGLALVTLGLLSSTLHLANPKNAWRSFSRFRTSWLSREGVFAVLFYPVILGYALVLWLNDGQMTGLAMVLGVVCALLAFAIVVCTGMIYASLKPIRQWHNPLTTPLYILFSLTSGSLLLALLDLALHGRLSTLLLICFSVSLLIAAIVKLCYFLLIGKPDGSTINTATGFSQAQVRLLDAGHNADTFLTKEFVFDVGARKLLKLRRLMLLLAFVLPLTIVAIAFYTPFPSIAYLAFISLVAGLLVERWLFFAEARHVVRLYHGDQRT
jgi:DMSO reductase anchor subunit